jgi:hypothetical protein
MNYVLVFRLEARNELNDAYTWYETQQPGLGDDFLEFPVGDVSVHNDSISYW